MMRLLAAQLCQRSGCDALLLAPSAARARSIRSSIVAMGHGSHSSDNNPHVLEREKQRNLKGETPEIVPGEPGWNPALASESEAAVRAERAPSLPMEELQKHSVKIIQHLHHDGEHPGVPDEVHNPSQSPAIKENLKESEKKLADASDPL